MQFASSDALMEWIAGRGQPLMLSFSTGKDSIGSWLQLRKYGIPVCPVYMYTVPRLSFIEQSLSYFEDFFGVHIMRMPHPSLYRMLRHLVYQPPERVVPIEELDLPEFDYIDVFDIARDAHRVDRDTLCAVGVRATDSPMRWTAIKRHGPVNLTRKQFYPIYDWNKDRLLGEIKAAKIKLPLDYRLFGRSFDGIDYRYLKPLYEQRHDDFLRVLEMFPLAVLDVLRHEYRKTYWE